MNENNEVDYNYIQLQITEEIDSIGNEVILSRNEVTFTNYFPILLKKLLGY